jgi:hypothetical protein
VAAAHSQNESNNALSVGTTLLSATLSGTLQVIHACALELDLQILPAGDQSMAGGWRWFSVQGHLPERMMYVMAVIIITTRIRCFLGTPPYGQDWAGRLLLKNEITCHQHEALFACRALLLCLPHTCVCCLPCSPPPRRAWHQPVRRPAPACGPGTCYLPRL